MTKRAETSRTAMKAKAARLTRSEPQDAPSFRTREAREPDAEAPPRPKMKARPKRKIVGKVEGAMAKVRADRKPRKAARPRRFSDGGDTGNGDPTWADTARQAAENLPSSAAGAVEGVGHILAHPVEALRNAMTTDYGQRYGSLGNIKRTVASDPVGAARDVTLATGTGALARAASMAKTAAGLAAQTAVPAIRNGRAAGGPTATPYDLIAERQARNAVPNPLAVDVARRVRRHGGERS